MPVAGYQGKTGAGKWRTTTQFSTMMQFGHSATPVMNTLMRESTTHAPVRRVRITRKRKRMNSEYLQAKFDLCIKQAEKDLQEEEIARAVANLRRANSAMARLFGIEDENE